MHYHSHLAYQKTETQKFHGGQVYSKDGTLYIASLLLELALFIISSSHLIRGKILSLQNKNFSGNYFNLIKVLFIFIRHNFKMQIAKGIVYASNH